MLTLKKVAVTGGLACGKSTVCKLLSSFGAFAVNADSIVHQLLSSDVAVISQVVDLLGPDVIIDCQLDRSKIANTVFSRPELLQPLEDLLHPAVKLAIEQRYTQVCAGGLDALFVAEIPLFFESDAFCQPWFDLVVCVVADEEICRSRWGQNDFDKRRRLQWPLSVKAAYADIVIDNSGSLETLQSTVQALFYHLTIWT